MDQKDITVGKLGKFIIDAAQKLILLLVKKKNNFC